MAGISTAISVQDRVSGSLNRITASLYSATSAFDAVDRASETTFNTAGVQAMTRELYAYEEHIQQIESELVRVTKRLDDVEDETKQAKSAAGELQSAFNSIAGAVASLGIGMLIKQQVTEAINYASDLTEVQNVVDTVFGDNSAINEWSKTTLEAFGLNELTAKQFAGTMGAMLSSSGLEKEAESMSKSMTALAGDMASFYNLDAEEAFNKIRSGISGETEPLKQLGINMSVANLEAYALAQGIKTSYGDMDQASQTMLRYNYLLETTANAQGDFAKTSDSYANQTKLLKENWSAFTGELATNALPLLAYGVGLLNDAVSFISENWSVIAPILGGLIAMVGAYTTALLICKGVQMASAIITGIHTAFTGGWTIATFTATVAQQGLNAALLACPITWIILAVIALIAVIIAIANYIAKTSDVAGSAFGVICGWIMVAGATFKNLGLTIANIAIGIGNSVAAIGSNIVTAFKNAIASVQSFWYNLLSTVLDVIGGIAKALNKLPFVEFDYSGITDKAQQYADKAAEAENKKSDEYKSVGGAFKKGMGTFDTFEKGWSKDAFAKGASWGDGVSDKVKKKLDGLNKAGTSGIDTSGAYSPVDTDNIKGIKDDTSNISKSVDVSNENLKYLRDIAEKDAINRFTTAEIKVDMKNNNTINNGMDIDGVINQLSAGLNEAMSVAAEGVH